MMPAVPGAPPDASMAFRLDARAVVTIHAPGLELLDGGLFNGLDGGCHGRHRQRGEQDEGLDEHLGIEAGTKWGAESRLI